MDMRLCQSLWEQNAITPILTNNLEPTMTKHIAVYGGGGFAREVAWLAQSLDQNVVCFIDDDEAKWNTTLNGIPVWGIDEAQQKFPDVYVVGGIGDPRTRQIVMEKAHRAGFQTTALIHPNVEYSNTIDVGDGTVICAGNILTVNITIGRHVQINLDCTVGHDVIMEDYSTLAPGVHVSGWVHLKERVYIGTGAVIINGAQDKPIVIGNDTVVGAGACVTKSLPEGVVAVGLPARPLKKD
jgi:sugar O-acyltransferase (sialic acid O-acetyltransferase NeuD family)